MVFSLFWFWRRCQMLKIVSCIALQVRVSLGDGVTFRIRSSENDHQNVRPWKGLLELEALKITIRV